MSDISISAMTPQAMALDNQLAGPESVKDTVSEVASGANQEGLDSIDQAVAGTEVASRSTEFFGNGPDFGSTGTDIDIQQAIGASISEGMGTIADKVV